MRKQLPTSIKDLLNSSYANQIIGVHLALQNGYTAEDIALHVLNCNIGWERSINNLAKNFDVIRYEKYFLDKPIKIQIYLQLDEPLSTEISINLNRSNNSYIIVKHRASGSTLYNKSASLILKDLARLIELEVFV